MGVLDKLKFWRKEETEFSDLGLGKDEFGLGLDEGPVPGMGAAPPGGAPSAPSPSAGQYAQDYGGYGQAPSATQPEQPSAFGMRQQQQQAQPPLAQPYQPSAPGYGAPPSKDYELITAKLDAIRAYLESISQRLSNIENMIKHERRW